MGCYQSTEQRTEQSTEVKKEEEESESETIILKALNAEILLAFAEFETLEKKRESFDEKFRVAIARPIPNEQEINGYKVKSK